jgi:hypothetical protein
MFNVWLNSSHGESKQNSNLGNAKIFTCCEAQELFIARSAHQCDVRKFHKKSLIVIRGQEKKEMQAGLVRGLLLVSALLGVVHCANDFQVYLSTCYFCELINET